MILEFTQEDLLQSVVLPPAWYRVTIDDVQEKEAAKGDSTNWWLKGKILFNADTGETEYKEGDVVKPIAGVPTPFPWIFNSKGKFAMVGFAQAMGMEVKPGSRFSFDACRGKQIDMFIENVVYEGVLKNAASGKYRAPRATTGG